MNWLLPAANGAAILALTLYSLYEIVALLTGKVPTISTLVQGWGNQYKFLLVLIEVIILAALSVLSLHFAALF